MCKYLFFFYSCGSNQMTVQLCRCLATPALLPVQCDVYKFLLVYYVALANVIFNELIN